MAGRDSTTNYEETPPARSLAQRMEALDRANAIRSARAELKQAAKADRSLGTLIHIIEWPSKAHRLLGKRELNGVVDTMRVLDLMLAARGIGRVAANKLLARCRIAPSKTIGGLSARQRAEIVAALRAVARRRTTTDRPNARVTIIDQENPHAR